MARPRGVRSMGGRRRRAAQVRADSAIGLLKADHRRIAQLFDRYRGTADGELRDALGYDICRELIVLIALKEEAFYPACRRELNDDESLSHAAVVQDMAKILIAELLGNGSDPFADAKVHVLSDQLQAHMKQEERPASGLFARARKAGVDTAEFAVWMHERKRALKLDAGRLGPSPPVSLFHLENLARPEGRDERCGHPKARLDVSGHHGVDGNDESARRFGHEWEDRRVPRYPPEGPEDHIGRSGAPPRR